MHTLEYSHMGRNTLTKGSIFVVTSTTAVFDEEGNKLIVYAWQLIYQGALVKERAILLCHFLYCSIITCFFFFDVIVELLIIEVPRLLFKMLYQINTK